MSCIIKNHYIIPENLYNEALSYAELSKSYTSDRHDFHEVVQIIKQKCLKIN